jgi:hypothetical protein
MVERMEERLEAAQSDQKNLFLIVFQVYYYILNFTLNVYINFDFHYSVSSWFCRSTLFVAIQMARNSTHFGINGLLEDCSKFSWRYVLSIFIHFNSFISNLFLIISLKICSIMSRWKSTVKRWKPFSSHTIWMAIFLTLFDNFKLFAVNCDKILQVRPIAKAFLFHGFSIF